MTKQEEKLCRKYAKSLNTDPKYVLSLYEHGDKSQRAIDRFAMKVTIRLRKEKKDGNLKADEKGKLTEASQKLADAIIEEMKAQEKNLSQFFTKPLPIIVKTKVNPDNTANLSS